MAVNSTLKAPQATRDLGMARADRSAGWLPGEHAEARTTTARSVSPYAPVFPSWDWASRPFVLSTDSELKGRWTDPPAEKWPFSGVLESRRIGASRCPSVPRGCASVDSTPQNSRFFFLARLVWFSATDAILDFGNCSNLGCINKGRRGFVLYVTQGPQIHSLFC